ncbi:MAG: hypothetical protein ACT4QC_07840 [Planctomycetaceae bacterium]
MRPLFTIQAGSSAWRSKETMAVNRWWIWPATFTALGILAVSLYDGVMTRWVGNADLHVQFVVADALSGKRLERSVIHVKQIPEGFCEGRTAREFELQTEICKCCMSFGTQSGLKFTDTYFVRLPHWDVRVSAEGYHESEPLYLPESDYVVQARRAGPGGAEVVIHVALSPNE